MGSGSSKLLNRPLQPKTSKNLRCRCVHVAWPSCAWLLLNFSQFPVGQTIYAHCILDGGGDGIIHSRVGYARYFPCELRVQNVCQRVWNPIFNTLPSPLSLSPTSDQSAAFAQRFVFPLVWTSGPGVLCILEEAFKEQPSIHEREGNHPSNICEISTLATMYLYQESASCNSGERSP